MTARSTPDDRLLREILRRADVSATNGPRESIIHASDETLAQFAFGALDEHERAELVAHLAQCADCRQVASALAIEAGKIDSVAERPSQLWLLPPRVMWALAASLLLAAGLWLTLSPGSTQLADQKVYEESTRLLAAGEFDKVRGTLENAARDGITSPRLRGLESQAIRQLRSPVALAQAGRLNDFGYGLDGTVARGSATKGALEEQMQAREVLVAAGSGDLEVVLNRGHLQLSMNHPDEAASDFAAATKLAPHEPLGWLGLGLAEFAQDDFAAAETAFRRAMTLAPENLAARINLAMTLDELGRTAESLAIWQAVLADPQAASVLTPDERKQIEDNIKRLKAG